MDKVAFHLGLRRMNNFLSLGVEMTVSSGLQEKASTMARRLLRCVGQLGHNELSAMAVAIQRS